MAKFKAKNDNKSTFFQAAFRSKYNAEAFPENDSLGPVGVVDFLFAERNLYGRVDQNLNVVVPDQSSLKRITSPENPIGTRLMNFVADQFIEFQRTFERALIGGKIRGNDPFLSKPRIYSSYTDPKAAYEQYFSNVMVNFENIYLNKKNTISAEDYFRQFLNYINQITPTFP